MPKLNPFQPVNPFDEAMKQAGIFKQDNQLFSGVPNKQKNTGNAEIQKEVPLPGFFPAQNPTGQEAGAKLIQGSDGTIFLEPLTKAQATQQGLAQAQGGLTPEQQAIENQNILNAKLAGINLNQIGRPTTAQRIAAEQGNKMEDIFKGAAPEIVAKGIAGGAIGAIAGGLKGGSVQAGTIAGGIAGVSESIIGALKQEAEQNTKVQRITFSGRNGELSNIKAIIKYANDGGDPLTAINLYNLEIAKIDRTERNLRQLSESEWLSKAKDELTMIQNFNDLERGNTAQLLKLAIQNPHNPNLNFEFAPDVTTDTTQ